jgi:hypothetical protein
MFLQFTQAGRTANAKKKKKEKEKKETLALISSGTFEPKPQALMFC